MAAAAAGISAIGHAEQDGIGALGPLFATQRALDLHVGRAESGAQGRAESPVADHGETSAGKRPGRGVCADGCHVRSGSRRRDTVRFWSPAVHSRGSGSGRCTRGYRLGFPPMPLWGPTMGRPAAERRQDLVALFREARGCTLCPLAEGRTQVVFGGGNADADLMFVGEAPGFHEDRSGHVPFVGRAGKLLDEMLVGNGLGPCGGVHYQRP